MSELNKENADKSFLGRAVNDLGTVAKSVVVPETQTATTGTTSSVVGGLKGALEGASESLHDDGLLAVPFGLVGGLAGGVNKALQEGSAASTVSVLQGKRNT